MLYFYLDKQCSIFEVSNFDNNKIGVYVINNITYYYCQIT